MAFEKPAVVQKVRRALVCPVFPQKFKLSVQRVFKDVLIYGSIAITVFYIILKYAAFYD